MRISELRNKELIDLTSGNRLGAIGDADLVVDERDGSIVSLIMPDRTAGGFTLFSRSRELSVPWGAVKKIGPEVVIVVLSPDRDRDRDHDRDRDRDHDRDRGRDWGGDRDGDSGGGRGGDIGDGRGGELGGGRPGDLGGGRLGEPGGGRPGELGNGRLGGRPEGLRQGGPGSDVRIDKERP
jgi:YlmC/YmxH family sporulation protein